MLHTDKAPPFFFLFFFLNEILLKKEKGKVKYEDVNQSLSKYNHKDKELRLPHQSNLLHTHDR